MAAAAVFAQLIVALSVLTISGSSDVIRVVGDSVQLEINGSVSEFDDFSWMFSGTVNVLKYYKKHKDVTHSPRYKDRVEFNKETCSLILKNLQKTDSGQYEVIAVNALQTTSLCTYRLSVLDPVEPPVLTVYYTTDPCNITVTCRGHDLSINSTCYKETCEEKEVTSPGGVALSLSVRNSIIICNHSNPASWKQEKITFTHLCDDTGTEPLRVHSEPNWTGILIPLVFLVIVVVGYCWIKRRRSADSRHKENPLYAGGEINDQPSSRETREETDSNEYSAFPQYPVSNGASGHNTDIMESVPVTITVDTEYTEAYEESPYEDLTDEPTSPINDEPLILETREETDSDGYVIYPQHPEPDPAPLTADTESTTAESPYEDWMDEPT